MSVSHLSLVSVQPFLMAASAGTYCELQHSRDHFLTEISCFELARHTQVKLVPDCFSSLLLRCGGDFDPVMAAPADAPERSLDLPQGAYYCVRFTPLSSYALYRVLGGMREFSGRVLDARAIFPDIGELCRSLSGEPVRAQARRAINAYFDTKLRHSPIDPVVHRAISDIIVSNGSITGAGLSAACGLSSRQLYNIFRGRVGLSPKSFSRALRFQNALYRLVKPTDVPFTPYEFNYYDQSHFLHEFKACCGMLPAQLLALLGGC
ncbi:AraC family transcriptional regulator [Feifania hominis]|uniref:AraC family transcriptional regulator n=1 Tax=Feifania hominis TaxID=2763660 RepID=A0A926DFL4_9FIRM|nr:helix-turn-helix domain-containing protein [Feifania hominis]MBC8536399.1 AraC family transcriptional regulator [Feifania hominis]